MLGMLLMIKILSITLDFNTLILSFLVNMPSGNGHLKPYQKTNKAQMEKYL